MTVVERPLNGAVRGRRRLGLRLPMGMADFERRGFRTDRPAARRHLERHARSFLSGFNLSHDPVDLHDRLAGIDGPERGFAYEGAGMRAALLDQVSRSSRHLDHLLDGAGQGYRHLVHVGAGWVGGMVRVRGLIRVPATPLLGWLALDGAGFAAAFFDAGRSVRRPRGALGSPWRQAELAGAGRALWFIESADPAGVAATIDRAPAAAQQPLWSGVGLACSYAGATDAAGLTRLLEAAGPHRAALRQGAVFGVTARQTAGIVPNDTVVAGQVLLGATPGAVAEWADAAAAGLPGDLRGYHTWRTRLRTRCRTLR